MQLFENDYDLEKLKLDFAEIRESFDMKINGGKTNEISEDHFFAEFDKILSDAVDGDIVAQDYISYLYKRGYKTFIPVSYRTYMKWAILAGANGNKFTIEKLKIFLTQPVFAVMNVPDFDEIIKKNGLFLENYEYIIGRLFCQALVDHFELETENLVKELTTTGKEDETQEMRVFEKAREDVLPEVLRFLRE